MAAQALEPLDAGLVVAVAPPDDAVAGHELAGGHGRVADDDELVVAGQLLEDAPGRDGLGRRHARARVQPVVDAVVKVVEAQVLEVAAAVHGAEQLAAEADVGVHGAADVHEQQHLDGVLAALAPDEAETAGVAGRLLDGLVEVELVGDAFVARGELAKAPQGELELPHADLLVGAVAAVAALTGDLDGGPVAALAAHADAAGVEARVAEGAGAAGADPVVAAVVGLGLLLEALLEHPLERLQVQVLERGGQQPALLVGEAGHRQRVREPVPDLVVDLHRRLDALEHGRERLVVLVEVRLGLDQDAARDRVELVQAGRHEAHGEPAHEREPLRDRDRHPVEAQQEEEVGEHGVPRVSASS